MKILKFTFLILLTLTMGKLQAQQILAGAGSVDSTFNNGDVAFADLSFTGGNPWGSVQQSDGKIVAFHEQGNISYLVRYNLDGSIDSGFGVDTIEHRGRSLLAGPNDELYLGTFTGLIIKMDADGTLDNTFSSDTVDTWIYGLDIQPDGKILTNGRANNDWGISRFNADGSIDSTFAIDGSLYYDFLNGRFDWGRTVQALDDQWIIELIY